MCYPLNGSDLSPDHTPLEAGLGAFVDLGKARFIGRDALLEQKIHGVPTKLAAIRAQEKSPPIRSHYINRYPRFGPRTDGGGPALPNPNAAPILGSGQPMLGGTMVVQFAAMAIEANGRYDIVIAEGGKEIVRAGMDLGKMR